MKTVRKEGILLGLCMMAVGIFCMDAKVVVQIVEHMRCTVNSTDSWEQWPEPSEPDYTDIYWAFDKSCDETMMNETLWDFIQMLHVFFEGKLEIDM